MPYRTAKIRIAKMAVSVKACRSKFKLLQKIISVANQKGGCCKSTLTMHLAGALASDGFKVLVVNADKQASVVKWASHAPDDQNFPAKVINLFDFGDKVHREVQRHYSDYDFTLVDCPPNLESVIPVSAAMISDLVLMPMCPTTTDLESLTDFLPVIWRVQAVRPGMCARAVISRYKKNTMSHLVINKLTEHEIPRMKSLVGDRTAFSEAHALGTHILAMRGVPPSAKREIRELRDETLDLLGVHNDE